MYLKPRHDYRLCRGDFILQVNTSIMEEQKKKPFYKRVWFVAVVIVAFLYVIGSSSNSNPQAPTGAVSTPATPPQREAIRVSARQLLQEYEDNQVSADTKYENNLVQVSGVVDSIGKDILDTPYISLKGRDSIKSVQCMFSKKDETALASVSKGEQLTLEGTLSGFLILNVIINDCKIVKNT